MLKKAFWLVLVVVVAVGVLQLKQYFSPGNVIHRTMVGAFEVEHFISTMKVSASQVGLVRVDVLRRLRLASVATRNRRRDAQMVDDVSGDLKLNIKNVVDDPVVGIGPYATVVCDTDELRRDPYPASALGIGGPTDRALERVTYVQLAPDLRDRLLGVSILSCTGSRDDSQSIDGRETSCDLFGHTIGEVLVVGRAEVFEWENHDPGQCRRHGVGLRLFEGIL